MGPCIFRTRKLASVFFDCKDDVPWPKNSNINIHKRMYKYVTIKILFFADIFAWKKEALVRSW